MGEVEDHSNSNDNQEKYIKDRVEEQIKWYDTKSKTAQKYYKASKIITLAFSAGIPLLVNLNIDNFKIKLIVSFLGASITISEGIINMNRWNENWIEYRTVCETLKHEKYMFINKSGVYIDKNSRFQYFVERVESIISKENVNWASLNKTIGGNKDG